jgi:hypothetical protein
VSHTVPKIWQISEIIGEEVPWRGSFTAVLGNETSFPGITGKFSLQETSLPVMSEICQIFYLMKGGH